MNSSAYPCLRPDNSAGPHALTLRRMKRWYRTVAFGLGCAALPSLSQALTFNISSTGNSQADAGFAAAGALWSSLFNDNVTVNITAGFSALGSGILGQAGSTQGTIAYTSVKTAMNADKASASDNTAVANLQAGSSLRLMMNRTSDNPNGAGSAAPFIDANGSANNTTIRMTSANAKALGLLAGNAAGTDATISFSTAYTWDFNRADGITGTDFDFVGIAAHEIGHALGFISGVDVMDLNGSGAFSSNQFTYVSTLDLFRFSTLSTTNTAIDWTTGTGAKYFSIDGGATMGAGFSTGVSYGDGKQASHWKDNLGLGIMDPTSARGELLTITTNDIRAFDVIGWNLGATATPDAGSSLAMMGMALTGIVIFRSRKSSRSKE